MEQPELCPVCGKKWRMQAKCPDRPRTCPDGHEWFMCPVHDKLLIQEYKLTGTRCKCSKQIDKAFVQRIVDNAISDFRKEHDGKRPDGLAFHPDVINFIMLEDGGVWMKYPLEKPAITIMKNDKAKNVEEVLTFGSI